jgi:cyclophilin family peptidyl-prolyl cis-trans isomerase
MSFKILSSVLVLLLIVSSNTFAQDIEEEIPEEEMLEEELLEEEFLDEEFSDKPHSRGTCSMARSQDPNSADSQFFICFAREERSRAALHD